MRKAGCGVFWGLYYICIFSPWKSKTLLKHKVQQTKQLYTHHLNFTPHLQSLCPFFFVTPRLALAASKPRGSTATQWPLRE